MYKHEWLLLTVSFHHLPIQNSVAYAIGMIEWIFKEKMMHVFQSKSLNLIFNKKMEFEILIEFSMTKAIPNSISPAP
jgi:hypothetical protein